MGRRRKRRKSNPILLAKLYTKQLGKCHWCGISAVLKDDGKVEGRYCLTRYAATIDHVNSRLKVKKYPKLNRNEVKVMACSSCNHKRGTDEEKELYNE